IWLTSNTPTAARTALCSSMIPEYWTGMSHPPKSTILAPRDRWTEFKGVARSAAASGMKIQANTLRLEGRNRRPRPDTIRPAGCNPAPQKGKAASGDWRLQDGSDFAMPRWRTVSKLPWETEKNGEHETA